MKCKLRKAPKYKKRNASIEVKKRYSDSFVDCTKVQEQQKKSESASIGDFFTAVREFFSGT